MRFRSFVSSIGRSRPHRRPVCLVVVLIGLAAVSGKRLRAQALIGPTVQLGQTSLSLPSGGSIYIYGMGTGGAMPATNFGQGPYAQVVDQGRQVVAGLAMAQTNTNSFTTGCADYTVAGVGVSGFKTVSASYAANNQPHPTSVSDSFLVSDPAVVVVLAIAGGEDHLEVQGLPGLQIDAQKAPDQSHGIAIAIGHASLPPGHYTVTEATEGDPGRFPEHEGDLIGVFVFTGGAGAAGISPGSSSEPTSPSPLPSASNTSTATEAVTVTIPAQAGPWDRALNPTFDFGFHDEGPPVTISSRDGIPVLPGTVLSVRYVAGTVSAGGDWPHSDANGALSRAPATAGPRSYPSRYIDPASYPIYVASLVGTFAKDGVIVGRPFKVGDGPVTLTVPDGANQLLLGVNDDRFSDNAGSWTVAVKAEGNGPTSSYIAAAAAAVLILAAAVVAFVGWRRKKAQASGLGASLPATTTKPYASPVTPFAAATSAQSTPRPAERPAPLSSEALDKLVKLKSLLDAGLITQEDFAREKAKLLR